MTESSTLNASLYAMNSLCFGNVSALQVLRSAARGELLVPWVCLAIMQQRAFSVAGPSAWNDLPFELLSLLIAHPSKFYISLSPSLVVTGLGAPLSSSLLNRCYISLQYE